jgi:hypothetical protein
MPSFESHRLSVYLLCMPSVCFLLDKFLYILSDFEASGSSTTSLIFYIPFAPSQLQSFTCVYGITLVISSLCLFFLRVSCLISKRRFSVYIVCLLILWL